MSIIHGRNPSFRQALPCGWNLSPSGEKYSWQDGKSGGAFCRILPVKEGACGVRLCCRSVLVALREACGSAPAARRNMRCRKDSPSSTRTKATCILGRLACALVKLRFTRLRSANPFFRDLLMTLDRRCRYPLPLALRAENAALALRAPSMPHDHARGGRRSIRR